MTLPRALGSVGTLGATAQRPAPRAFGSAKFIFPNALKASVQSLRFGLSMERLGGFRNLHRGVVRTCKAPTGIGAKACAKPLSRTPRQPVSSADPSCKKRVKKQPAELPNGVNFPAGSRAGKQEKIAWTVHAHPIAIPRSRTTSEAKNGPGTGPPKRTQRLHFSPRSTGLLMSPCLRLSLSPTLAAYRAPKEEKAVRAG